MGRKIRNIIFTAIAATVLCAGTLSARQLSLVVQDTTCQHHFCTRTQPLPQRSGLRMRLQQPHCHHRRMRVHCSQAVTIAGRTKYFFAREMID